MEISNLRVATQMKPAAQLWAEEEARVVLAKAKAAIEAKAAAKAKAEEEIWGAAARERARAKATAAAEARAAEEARIAAAATDKWFYLLNGEQFGPVSLAGLKEKISDFSIEPPLKMVWTEGMDGWKPVYEVRKLCESIASNEGKTDHGSGTPDEPKAEVEIRPRAAAEAKAAEKAKVAAAAKAEEDLRAKDAKDARIAAAEKARAKAAEEAKLQADAEAKEKAKAEERARTEAKAEAKLKAVEEARAAAEAKAAEEAKLRAAAEAKAAQEAKLRAEAEARTAAAAKENAKAEEQARTDAIAEAKLKAAEEARAAAEAKAAEEAKLRAAAEAKAAQETKLRAAAEANAAEEARAAAAARARAKAEEEARAKAETEAKLKAAAEARAAGQTRHLAAAEEEAKASAELEALAAEEARVAAAGRARVQKEARAKAEFRARAAAEARITATARRKARRVLKAMAAQDANLKALAMTEAAEHVAAAVAKVKAENILREEAGKTIASAATQAAQAKPGKKRKSAHSIWFYTCEGERLGPVRFEELREMAADSSLDPRLDMVWKQRMEAWIPAGQIDGLFERQNVPAESKKTFAPPAAPIFPPRQSYRTAMTGNATWPGARRRSFFLISLVFPFAWHHASAAISPFLIKQFGQVLMGQILPAAAFAPLVVLVWFGLKRLVNLGMSRWWCLAVFAPVLNLWVGYRCFACPPGYAYHKKLDGPGIALAILYWLVMLAAFVALLCGAIRSPALQEHLRGAAIVAEFTYSKWLS